jgi:hypothetical protein
LLLIQVELQRNELQNLLNTNLLKRQEELNGEINEMSLDQETEKVNRKRMVFRDHFLDRVHVFDN